MGQKAAAKDRGRVFQHRQEHPEGMGDAICTTRSDGAFAKAVLCTCGSATGKACHIDQVVSTP